MDEELLQRRTEVDDDLDYRLTEGQGVDDARYFQMVQLYNEGWPIKDIAYLLDISRTTIYRKYGDVIRAGRRVFRTRRRGDDNSRAVDQGAFRRRLDEGATYEELKHEFDLTSNSQVHRLKKELGYAVQKTRLDPELLRSTFDNLAAFIGGENVTASRVARELGVAVETVLRRADEAGLSFSKRLTADKVKKVKAAYTAGYKRGEIAKHLGVSEASIGRIKRGDYDHLLDTLYLGEVDLGEFGDDDKKAV